MLSSISIAKLQGTFIQLERSWLAINVFFVMKMCWKGVIFSGFLFFFCWFLFRNLLRKCLRFQRNRSIVERGCKKLEKRVLRRNKIRPLPVYKLCPPSMTFFRWLPWWKHLLKTTKKEKWIKKTKPIDSLWNLDHFLIFSQSKQKWKYYGRNKWWKIIMRNISLSLKLAEIGATVKNEFAPTLTPNMQRLLKLLQTITKMRKNSSYTPHSEYEQYKTTPRDASSHLWSSTHTGRKKQSDAISKTEL